MRNYSVAVAIFLYLAACDYPRHVEASCMERFNGTYSGVALATEAGDSSFAIAQDCSFFAFGTEEYYEQVRKAWQDSPYQGDIRPVYIEVEGVVYDRGKSNLSPLLKIGDRFTVSAEVNTEDVSEQFHLRLDRRPPARIKG